MSAVHGLKAKRLNDVTLHACISELQAVLAIWDHVVLLVTQHR